MGIFRERKKEMLLGNSYPLKSHQASQIGLCEVILLLVMFYTHLQFHRLTKVLVTFGRASAMPTLELWIFD